MSKQIAVIQPLGLATILALGFGVLIGVFVIWIISLSEGYTQRESIAILFDGTPVIQRWSRKYSERQVRTLDEHKVPAEKLEAFLYGGDLVGPKDLELKSAPYSPVRFPLQAEDRIQQFSDGLEPPTYWYFIDDGNLQGKGYFIGFNSESKQCIGYLGTQGFRRDEPAVENWFPMDGRKMDRLTWTRASFCPGNKYSYEPYFFGRFNKVAMISGDKLLLIDLRERSIATLMQSADIISLCLVDAAAPPQDKAMPSGIGQYILTVRTAESVVLFDSTGKQLCSYVIPEDLRDKTFSFYNLGDEKALITQFRRYPDFVEQLTWLDTTGKVLRREKVALTGRGGGPPSKTDVWKMASVLAEPITLTIVATIVAPINGLEGEEEISYAAALSKSFSLIWQPLVVVCILSAGLAYFCYRRQRRMALPWTWVWVGFVFLCGVPGLLAYHFHRRWPVLEKCNVCDHAVPRDREKCAACGSEFPTPAPKGIEVFA